MIGQVISHYRVIEQIGAGGMGVVYRAEDTRLGRPLVLKFLPPAASRDPMALARFEREARTASSMNHPGICTVYDIGEFEGQRYIAMEYLEGQPLDRFIGGKPVAVPTLIDLAVQITDAIELAHTEGILHRDIKPANIFITKRDYDDMKRYDLQAQTLIALGSYFPKTRHDAWWEAGEVFERRVRDVAKAKDAYSRVPTTSRRYRDAQKKLSEL